jgi:hypothetical protein
VLTGIGYFARRGGYFTRTLSLIRNTPHWATPRSTILDTHDDGHLDGAAYTGLRKLTPVFKHLAVFSAIFLATTITRKTEILNTSFFFLRRIFRNFKAIDSERL